MGTWESTRGNEMTRSEVKSACKDLGGKYPGRPNIPDKIHNHIRKVVDFFIDDERDNYLEFNTPRKHIYLSLKEVDEWLGKSSKK